MKSYTVLSKDINKYRKGNNKNTDICLYAYLKLCSDYRTGICRATQKKIHELSKIKFRTLQSSLSRIRETELVNVKHKNKGIKTMNVYHFDLNPPNFFFVNNSFYYTDIEVKEKGLLLLIKSLCINNTNVTLYSRNKIAQLLEQDRGTISKMINNLILKNMILEVKNGFVLPANYFPFYSKDKKSPHEYENFNSSDEFVLNSILDFCNEKGTILFVSDIKPLKVLFANYPYTEKDFENLDKEAISNYYLPEILRKRCHSLPSKIESLNYFLKILNIEYVEEKEEVHFTL